MEPSSAALIERIETQTKAVEAKYSLDDVLKIDKIRDARDAYRKLGQDPSRYRVSSEALLRRIVKGMGLYLINNIVDINNLVSLGSGFSLCSYNLEKLEPPITFQKGAAGETYEAIGRGEIKLENLPVFKDSKGPFGSTTSDSDRAKVDEQTQDLLMILVAFNGMDGLEPWVEAAGKLLVEFGHAENLTAEILA